jgi:hypothetical protein
MIEKQLGRLERPLRARHSVAVENEETRAVLHRLRQARFEQVRLLYDAAKTATAISQELGLSRKRVGKWIRQETLPERSSMAPPPRSPAYYQAYLSRRWAERCTLARCLFTEIQCLGFTRSYTHLSQFVAAAVGGRSERGHVKVDGSSCSRPRERAGDLATDCRHSLHQAKDAADTEPGNCC